MNKSMQITPPEGYEVDTENSTFENIVFKEKVKSTRWEDLKSVSGYFTTANSYCDQVIHCYTTDESENVYATKAQCEAHLAQAKLSQIMKSVNGDWKPDWSNACQPKYYIYLDDDGTYNLYDCAYAYPKFLTFKSKELAEQVLRENKDLLDQYKPLAG